MISVIIPAYNAEKYLSEALDSLLVQEYPDLEVLLVDDGSTDRTREIAETHPIRCTYFYQTNQGVSHARNNAIRKARGRFLAFLDADDVYLPGKLRFQSNYLDQNPQIDLVLCGIQRTDENLRPFAAPMTCFLFGAALIRKTVFDRVGLCNPDFIRGEDFDWFLRSRDLEIPIAHQAECGLLYRQHPGSRMEDVPLNRQYFYLALQQSIQRGKHAAPR